MARIYLVEISAMLDQCVLRGGAHVAANGAWYYGAQLVPYNAGNAYTVTASARRNVAATGALYVGLAYFNASGVLTGFDWVAASGVTPGTAWGTYTGTLAAGGAPGGTTYIAPAVVLNHGSGAVGQHECQSLRVGLSTSPTVALNDDEFFRSPPAWLRYSGDGVFARLFDGTPYAATLRFGTAGYMTRPTDTPANAYFDGRVLQPSFMRQEMPQDYAGAAAVGYGELVLANADGALSHLAYAGLDGQLVRVLTGDSDLPFASNFRELFRAKAETAIFDDKRLVIRLKDGMALLDRPLLTNTFAGNNALPAGLEGGPEIKGTPKPKLFGRVQNLPAPCINSSRLIYLVSDGGWNGGATSGDVTAVYDRGVALTNGGSYLSQVDMETNAPAAGQYRVWHAGAMFRLGSTPVGLVTCDAQANTSGASQNTWQEVMRYLARTVLPFADVNIPPYSGATQPDNWPGANLCEVGVWVNDSRTAIEALELIAKSCGVFFGWIDWRGGTRDAVLYAEAFPLPYTSRADSLYGAVRYYANSIQSVRPVAAPDEGAGVPAWRVQLGYSPVLQLQEFDVDAGVSLSRKSFLANERRQISASDAGIKTKHGNAITLVRDTQIVSEAAAGEEATRQLQLRRYRRAWFEVVVSIDGSCDPDAADNVQKLLPGLLPRLGGYVRLVHPQLRVRPQNGVDTADSYFNVMAMEVDMRRGQLRLTVRQATEPTL